MAAPPSGHGSRPGSGSRPGHGSRPGSAAGGSSSGGSGRSGRGSRAPGEAEFISRYQILEKIAEGGMGALYLARDPAIDRLLAIKLLRRGFDTDELRGRFAREAKAAGRLRHPNIVTIFDVGEHDGDPFIAMEFLAGETLDELIRHGARLSLARRLKLLEELCDGLAYAHRAGIVHRDIKPANVIVDSEGILKILDFGIVRLEGGGSTAAGMLVGTVNYMCPEQVGGGEVDNRSDIFAVGLVAYELLTSKQAFPGTVKDGLFNRIINVDIEPLGRVLPQLDSEVVSIVERALRADPAERYQDLAQMRNDLVRVRQRIEAIEQRVADQMVADFGETAFVAAPGPLTPAAGVAKSGAALRDAERALESGNYRKALTLAGRSAASNPRDPQASVLMARAEAGLLQRGRTLEESGAVPAPSGGVAQPIGSGAILPSGAYAAPAVHPLIWAVVGAVVILVAIVAGVVVPKLMNDSRGEAPARTQQESAPPAAVPSVPPSTVGATTSPAAAGRGAAEPPAVRTERPQDAVPPPRIEARTPARPEPPARTPRESVALPDRTPVAPAGTVPAIVRAGRDVPPPRRIKYVEPQYPADALDARTQATVKVGLTIGREGRVADVRVVESAGGSFDAAAVAAARQWEFVPTVYAGSPVAVSHVVDVEFSPPPLARPAPPPVAVAGPTNPPPAPASREQPSAVSSPQTAAPDPAAEDAAIRAALRRYESAWEARDPAALARVQQLSGGEAATIRRTMAEAQEYAMDVNIQSIKVDPDARRATARCAITRRFRGEVGRGTENTAVSTLTFEKRGDTWIITSMR